MKIKLILIATSLFTLIGCSSQKNDEKYANVILLYGQSNMAGCSLNSKLEERFPSDYEKVKDGFDNCKIRFIADSNHNKEMFDYEKVKLGQGTTISCFGPEIGIASYLKDNKENENLYIIKYAIGGTSLHIDWNSPNMVGIDGQVYKNAMGFTDSSLQTLLDMNLKIKIKAICWMQGEEDSMHQEQIGNYEINTNNFIEGLRDRFSEYAPKEGICFIDAGISSAWQNYFPINQAKRNVASKNKNNIYIDTIENNLEYNQEPAPDNPDNAHFDSQSEFKLGQLFGREIAEII